MDYYARCIICQDTKSDKLSEPQKSSYDNLIAKLKTRREHANREFDHVLDALDDKPHEVVKNASGKWHPSCYKKVTNKTDIDRLLQRYNLLNSTADIPTVIDVKLGRRPANQSENLREPKRCRRDSNFDKNKCALCQVHEPETPFAPLTVSLSEQLREIAGNTCTDEIVRCRLSPLLTSDNPLAGMAFDLKYHHKCLVKHQRKTNQVNDLNSESNAIVLSNLEILDMVIKLLNDGTTTLSMNMSRICILISFVITLSM